jgi:hypothetical protein
MLVSSLRAPLARVAGSIHPADYGLGRARARRLVVALNLAGLGLLASSQEVPAFHRTGGGIAV